MAATKRRAKELARAKEERRRARQAAALAKRRRRQRLIAALVAGGVVLALIGVYVLPAAFDGEEESPAQPVAACSAPGEMQDTPKTFAAAGDGGLGDAASATFTMRTNCGDIVIEADAAAAPATVNSMAFLAAEDYFDNTICHRLTTDGLYVLQCGDPTGSGSGSPGYALAEENLPPQRTNNYPAGTVAMANSGEGTTGSQFFIVHRDSTLPSSYTIWGTVTSGLDTVSAVAAAGTTDGSFDGAPAQGVMIQDVTVVAE